MNLLLKHKTRLTWFLSLAFSAFIFSFTTANEHPSADTLIPYPEGYQHWHFIESAITGVGKKAHDRFDGYQHIFANDLAMQGYKTGKFPDGAVFVYEKRAVDTLGTYYRPGKRKFIDIMFKDQKRFAATGGWGFEEFNSDSKTEGRISGMRQLNCYKSCHQAKAETDFVFSRIKE